MFWGKRECLTLTLVARLTQNSRDANDTLVRYMEQIQRASRDAGIVVPFNSNEKNFRGPSWTTDFEPVGDSAVDLYGLDDYPGALSCSDIEAGFHVEREYYQWFQNYSYTQPNFWPEFEGKLLSLGQKHQCESS